jgi:proteic killer suppression protein
MITSIADQTTRDIFDGLNSKAARKLPRQLHRKAQKLLDLLNGAASVNDLRIPPGNHLEVLKGKWNGFHSIRINDQWRIVFRWTAGDAEEVCILDYH